MPPLKVLICGGGCAGPALAFWLVRAGHHVVVVERFPALRASGAQIDLRAQGIQAVERMGLLDTVREQLVKEDGVSMVDSRGNVQATIMANKSGKGAQSLTSEFEIMRGDFVRVLYEATKNDVEYMFGKTVESFEQDDAGVLAHFSDGTSDKFDILVGADGQGSRIRKAILPKSSPDPYRRLGFHIAYWFIPRDETDDNLRRSYLVPGGRLIFRRTHSPKESHVYFMLSDSNPALSSISKASVEEQKEFWATRFADGGWQTPRFIDGMKTTHNWYCQEVVQVRTDTWHKDRVILLGDAAYCPSPFSGMGTSLGLVGAYVLAGEIARRPDDLARAFENYDASMRPFVAEVQKVNPMLRFLPKSRWGIAVLLFVLKVCCWLRIPDIMARFAKEEKGGWKLPVYPELHKGATKD